MNLINFLYRLYFSLPNFGRLGKLGKGIDRGLDTYVLKKIFDKKVPGLFRKENSSESGINSLTRDEKYIVSLTSFPARIREAWISIECILRQSYKPDRIILWLAEEQFPERKLPQNLRDLQKRGLEIEFCEDLKSHKKYYYAMKRYPDANIITLDDDLYYDSYVIENLVELHKKYPENIVANRAHRITFKKGVVKPYKNWKHNVTEKIPSYLLLHTSGAGVLFPPKVLPEKAFDKEEIRKLSFRSDDVWLKIMSILGEVKIVTNSRYNKDFITAGGTQAESLVSTNSKKGGKDIQLKNVCSYYKIDLAKIKD